MEDNENLVEIRSQKLDTENGIRISSSILGLTAKVMAELLTPNPLALSFFFSTRERKSLEEKKIALVKELVETGVDPYLFDSLLSNEINRRLKVQFGVVFIVLTFIFTSASYLIIILDSIYSWGISQVAITALIIEIPLQFIGIMYIIARNLFPNKE
jgi:hypothetical protein